MRLAEIFTQTLREAPADVDRPGHAFLIRAGYLQPLGSGLFAALPLGEAALRRLEKTACQCFDLTPGQKISLPAADEQTGMLAAVAGGQIRSYRQLPANFYQTAQARKEPVRPRGGWLGSRSERVFSLFQIVPEEELPGAAGARAAELVSFFAHCRIAAREVEGARETTEWHLPLPGGSSTLLECSACGYASAQEAARFSRPPARPETPLPLEKVGTPHCPTIESLAQFLNIPTSRTAKAVFLTAELAPGPNNEPGQQLIFAVVRGDREVNETALLQHTGALALRPASDEEILAVGAVPGYASPIGVRGARVIVDPEAAQSPNLVAGANDAGFHLLNVNYGRDYAGEVAEIAAARAGDACPCCGQPLRAVETVLLAQRAQHERLPGCSYRDESGQARPAALLEMQIYLNRIIASIAETRHDERGLRLPPGAAPYPVYLVVMPGKSGPQPEETAVELARWLAAAGLEPLVDDRSESAGVRFNDADLIGLPLRITVSERALKQGGVEFKTRSGGDAWIVPVDLAVEKAMELLANG